MRVFLLSWLLAAGLGAQTAPPKEIKFQDIGGGSFAGFSEDEKAEKAWELTAARMKPTTLAGTWEMEKIEVRSYRGGQPQVTFASPYGTASPERKSAQGSTPITARSTAFNLAGMGWSWRSTNQGDTFAILSDVSAELDLAKPVLQRLRIHAERLDAAPVAQGNQLTFVGKVVVDRRNERLTCERLVCLIEDGPKGVAVCRSIRALGKVVRRAESQTLTGESADYDLTQEVLVLAGGVTLTEPGFEATSDNLRHETKADVTTLRAAVGQPVRLRVTRPADPASELTGETITLRRAAASSRTLVECVGQSTYLAGEDRFEAVRMTATVVKGAMVELLATGGVRGTAEGARFEAEEARWERAQGILRLSGRPHLKDRRGFELAGFTIFSDRQHERVEVRSGPGVRAAARLPAGPEAGAAPGQAEADQVVLTVQKGVVEADLDGSVRYVAGLISTQSDRLVAFAVPGKSGHVLSKVFLTGKVTYIQPGLACSAERIDYVPAVEIEEVLKKDRLAGQPRLLNLSGGAEGNRPRLFVQFADGKKADFVADAHEILSTPEAAKFFLRGNVGMKADGVDASCDLLEGLVTPDRTGRMVARLMVGRGNVNAVAGESAARGRVLEVKPEEGLARLTGDARLRTRAGIEGVPAKEVLYDFKAKSWRMESAPDPAMPDQVVRPKIFLGEDFTLPAVKSLDKGR
jgi:lipopolysaccharide export system protein LptA